LFTTLVALACIATASFAQTKKEDKKAPAAKETKTAAKPAEKKEAAKPAAAAKPEAKPAPAAKTKADGTPDMRYKENKDAAKKLLLLPDQPKRRHS